MMSGVDVIGNRVKCFADLKRFYSNHNMIALVYKGVVLLHHIDMWKDIGDYIASGF